MTDPGEARRHPSGPADVVGVWRLVGGSITDEDGTRLGRPYGPEGAGLLSLSADGRMMAVLVDGRAEVPAGEEREFASYCGTYTFDGAVLTTTTYAHSADRFATPQVRRVRLEDGRLILVPPQVELRGRRATRELVWERVAMVPA